MCEETADYVHLLIHQRCFSRVKVQMGNRSQPQTHIPMGLDVQRTIEFRIDRTIKPIVNTTIVGVAVDMIIHGTKRTQHR